MLSRFSEVLATAADVLAPPAPRLEDFQYHWKLIQNLYINQDVHSKIRIEDTKVPFHLDKMLQLLVEEENEQPSIVGPCLEKIINKTLGVLECLTVLAGVDHPPGARAVILTWYTSLLRRIKHPLINHIAIYQPIQSLLILCSDQAASPTEREEVELLLTLCGLVRRNPDLANVFATPYMEERHKIQNVPKEILDILPSKCQIRTPTKNKLFEVDVPIEPVKRVSLVSQESGGIEDGHLHLVARPHGADCCNETMTSSINGDDNTSCKSQKTIYDVNDKFLLTDLLVNYLMSADNHIVLRACEGIMIVSSLPDDDIANLITSCSTVCESIIDKLIDKYKGIPANIDPSEVDQLKINWGFVQHDFIDKSAVHFVGYRELTAFLSWLDYCDTLMKECHPAVALNLARTFRRNFLEAVVEPALGDLHHTVLITAIVSKCLKVIDSTEFLNEMSNWLVGDGEIPEWPLLHTLIDNCLSENLELSLETLRFFESIIERPAEHSLQRLVLCHVSSRGYHALPGVSTVAPSGAASVDEEREWLNDVSLRRERERNSQVMEQLLHEGNINQQISDALESCGGDLNDAPNIHKIINSFLLMLPKALLSDPVNFSYEELEDPLNYYQTNIRQLMDLTSGFNWPTEAVWPDTTASSTHSYDSRPEADHHLHCRNCASEIQNNNETETSQQAENAKTCGNATMHYETCRHHKVVSYKSQQSRDSTETEPEIKLSDDCCQISVFEMDNICTNNAATCPFSQNLVFRKKDRCCPAKGYEDEEVFYEGPFLRMIFHLLANMPYQPYQINLLLTTIVSKLAMLPHPYLHEYLLNPVLPVSRGTNTLFKVLQEVAKVLTMEVVKIKDYRILLERTRQMLLEAEVDYDDSYEHNQLIAALIVLEEFCKDLAGISLVKYLLNE